MTPRLDALPARDARAAGSGSPPPRRASQRLRGLAGLDAIAGRRRARASPRCRSVHTFGMRFALDLVWLGADGRGVVRVDRDVRAAPAAVLPRARGPWSRSRAGRGRRVRGRAAASASVAPPCW